MWPQLFLIGTLVLTAYTSPLPRQERRSAPPPLIRCDSFLRIIFPDQYPDCSCTYSEWSEWTPIPDSTVRVNSSQCPSGEAYQDIRQRTATIEGCPKPVENETQWMCLPDREDRLIMALGLGSSGGGNVGIMPLTTTEYACQNIIARAGGHICSNHPYTSGKRSVEESEEQQDSHSDHREEVVTLDVDPIPFKWSEHHKRFRRQNSCSGQNQYVLFVLDTSGSIGQSNFARMTETIATLSTLFCKPVQIAVMTFSTNFKLEFCFNCFDSSFDGRTAMNAVIKSIPYRGGLTRTGGATRCVCDELLDPSCGLPLDASCIDVVFITDGYSNDLHLEICDEVKCIHDHTQYTTINTHSIGIANANPAELACIEQTDGVTSAFDYNNFDDFNQAIQDIHQKFTFEPDVTCADTTGNEVATSLPSQPLPTTQQPLPTTQQPLPTTRQPLPTTPTTSPTPSSPSLIRCDSFLRIIFPDQYLNCSCIYTEWSEWTPIPDSTVRVNSSQCPSGEAYQDIRQRTATIERCPTPVEKETQWMCLPDQEDRLIMALGLGSSGGGNAGPTTPEPPTPEPPTNSTRHKRQTCARESVFICTNPPYTNGKRSVEESEEQQDTPSDHREEVVTLDIDPIPFKWSEHHKRFRRQNSCSGKNQYVLFVLDTSGSIGPSNFQKMREAVANLSTLFCKPVQIAVMTFSSGFKLEFCFNCFDSSDPDSPTAMNAAIKNIPYRGGLTRTGGAARCVCDELLNPSCGLPSDASCIDVVFITDGYSNDPSLEICDEVKCIHDHMQYTTINTHSIGIANANQNELDCIEKTDSVTSAFKYDSFAHFTQAIQTIINTFTTNPDTHTCTDTTECIYGQWSDWTLIYEGTVPRIARTKQPVPGSPSYCKPITEYHN